MVKDVVSPENELIAQQVWFGKGGGASGCKLLQKFVLVESESRRKIAIWEKSLSLPCNFWKKFKGMKGRLKNCCSRIIMLVHLCVGSRHVRFVESNSMPKTTPDWPGGNALMRLGSIGARGT